MANGNTEGWEFRKADLNDVFPLADASADAVVANQVIEHILDPFKFAHEIYRILRPGGRCVVTTPNIRYLVSIQKSGYLESKNIGPGGRGALLPENCTA